MDLAELKIGKFIENNTSDMIRTLSELVKIPSVKGEAEPEYPFGREPARALEKFLSIAEGMGFTVKNHENYVGTVDFYPAGEPTLGILCHLDVVPVGNTGWKTPPFELTLKNGYLYGRGSIDDKGPAVSVLYAMYALKKLGISLSQNVRFIVGTDEENGSADLAYYRKKEALPARLFTPDGSYPVINIEKGMVRGEFEFVPKTSERHLLSLAGGDVVNAVPAVCTLTVSGVEGDEILKAAEQIKGASVECEKNGGDISVSVFGKSAHASQPEGGVNAVTAALKLLSILDIGGFEKISSVFPFGESDGEHAGVKMSDEKSGALTLVHSVASFDGEVYRGKFDIRFPVTSSVDKVRAKMESAVSKAGAAITAFGGVEGHMVDGDGEFVKTLLECYEHVTGKRGRCIAIGGGTYVHETEGGVAFGAEFLTDHNNMHGANERMAVDLFKMNARMYADAIIRLCK